MLATLAASLISAMAPKNEAPDVPVSPYWGHFERNVALSGNSETVDISTLGVTENRVEYRLRLLTRKLGGPVTTRWAESRTCPAIRDLLTQLHALTPVITPPGFGPAHDVIIVDGAYYSLTIPAADSAGLSKITWTSNVNTPLAAWIDQSFMELKSCWKSEGPAG